MKFDFTEKILNLQANQNSIYKENIQALQKKDPDLARFIQDISCNKRYQAVKHKNCLVPNLISLPDKNLYYDKNDPLQDAEQQIEELKLKNTRLAIFLGIGLGYELLYYIDKLSQQQNTEFILIVEKDAEMFKLALETTNLVPIIQNDRVKFMVNLEENQLFKELRDYLAEDYKFFLLKAYNPVYHISSLKLNKDYYLTVLKSFREAAIFQLNHYGNDPNDSLIGIKNMMGNLNEIIYNPGVNLLFNKFKNKPAVVVSTGPSLNKNKHLLKGLEDKAVIIAADASLKILLEMGVKPHFVTALERTMGIFKLFEGINSEDVQDVYLAACPVIDPRVYEVFPGPRLIVYRNFDHFKWLGIDRGFLDIKMSSGNMAFKLAHAMGCNPIILIGQDLAFSRDGKTHASGMALGEKRDVFYERGTLEVMGNDGSPILTSQIWNNFLKAYELDIAAYDGICINATEGGAYINGTEVMTFEEAINKYINSPFNPLEYIKNYLASFSATEMEKDKSRVISLIDQTVEDMQEIMANCQEGINIHEKYKTDLENSLKDVNYLTMIRPDIDKIGEEILKPRMNCTDKYNTYQLFLLHVFQSYNIEFEMEMIEILGKYEDEALGRIEFLLKQAEWYKVLGGIVEICLQFLLQAKENLINLKNP